MLEVLYKQKENPGPHSAKMHVCVCVCFVFRAACCCRQGCFTEEGQPGEGLRGEYKGLEQALRIPEDVATHPLVEEAGLAGRQR